MPAIAALPPRPPVVHVFPVADSFGEEGTYLSNAVEQAARHWEERAEWILKHSDESDELDYEIVPLGDAGIVRVKYEFAGEIQPLPYEWDE